MDLHLHPATLTPVKIKVRGLGDDDHVRPEFILLDDILPAEPVAVLLHNRPGEIDRCIPVEPQLLKYASCRHKGSRSSLLIDRAATMNITVAYLATQRVKTPVALRAQVNGVHMSVDGQYPLSGSYPANDIAQAVNANLIKAGLLHLAFKFHLNLFLPGCQRLDSDKLREVIGRIITVFLREFSYFLTYVFHDVGHLCGKSKVK